MPRRHVAVRRETMPDPKFGSQIISKFVSMIMESGKKSIAEQILYKALDRISAKKGGESLKVLEQAMDRVRPVVEVKSRRVGGATYQVPVEVRSTRRSSLAMKWLIDAARKRSEKSMAHRLAGEIMDAAESKGSAIKKKEDTHRMAEANKAFSHYRW